MLRVLHCIYDDPGNPWVAGGGALRVREIYSRLAGRLDATVVTGNYPGAADETVAGVRYRRLGAASPYPWSRLTYGRAATRLLAAGRYDVGLFDFSVYTPLRLPRNRPVGVVVHMLHGPTAPDRFGPIAGRIVRAAERRALARARWVSTTSRWMLEQLRPVIRHDARVALIGSGVPEEFARVERREEEFLLYYGRFDLYQKGLDVLLEAFAALALERPGLRLVLAGRGKDLEEIRGRIGALGIGERVELHPGISRSEVLRLFAGALVLAMPSRLEGLPMVPAEAMAAGIPVVATEVGAVAEVVDPPHGGVLVPADDVDALAEGIRSLLDAPERRRAVSRSARQVAQRFSWDTVAEQHLDFLHEIAAEWRALSPNRSTE